MGRSLLPIALAVLLPACRGGAREIAPAPDVSASAPPPAAPSAPDAGDAGPPPREFVPAKDISDDDAYLWKEGAGYRVTLLFDQHGRSKNKGRPSLVVGKNEPAWDYPVREMVVFGEHLFGGLRVCRTPAGEIALGHEHEYLALAWGGAYVGADRRRECQRDIDRRQFYAEGRDYDDQRGFTYRTVRTDVTTEVGIVRITYQGAFCQDTGRHHVEIRGPRGSVVLRDTLTLELFEEDLDGDGAKELYVMSEQACGGWLRVVRVVAER